MNIKEQRMYSEVYNILNSLGNEYIKKLPNEVYKTIEKYRDSEYNPKYDLSKDIKSQEIDDESIAMVTLLNLKYWCNKEEREKLVKILNENEEKYKTEMKERYDLNKVLNKNNTNIINEKSEDVLNNQNSLIEVKDNFFSKIIKKIKSCLKRGE